MSNPVPFMSVALQVYVLTKRNIFRLLRTPPHMISSIVFPGLLLVFFFVMFNDAASRFEDGQYIQRLVPGMLLTAITFGSVPMAVAFQTELRSPFLQRLRTMPVWPQALLLSRLLSEVVRVLLAAIVLVSVGWLLGFRVAPDPAAIAMFAGVLVLAALVFSSLSFLVAMIVRSSELLTPLLTVIYLCGIFVSLGMGPVSAFPQWVQPVVAFNPVSVFSEALRLIASGGGSLSI